MNNKHKLYLLLAVMAIVCFLNLFLFKTSKLWVFAVTLCAFALWAWLFVKTKKGTSGLKKQVMWTMLILAIVFLMIVFLMGFMFSFGRSAYFGQVGLIIFNCLTLLGIVFASEYIRFKVMISGNLIHKIWFTILMIMLEIMMISTFSQIKSLEDFMLVVGLGVFSGITKNLFFNYTVSRYGIYPNIIYSWLTQAYAYFMPILPRMDDMFLVLIRMIMPLVGYFIVKFTFEPKRFVSNPRAKRGNAIVTVAFCVFATILIGLVSCKFTYRSLVIATESMTGAINKGDSIVYSTKYDKLEVGDIIVFNRNGMKVVHRIVEKQDVDNVEIYYTKGDYNESRDGGYITRHNIEGVVLTRVPLVGWPTLFVNKLFNG